MLADCQICMVTVGAFHEPYRACSQALRPDFPVALGRMTGLLRLTLDVAAGRLAPYRAFADTNFDACASRPCIIVSQLCACDVL